MTLSLSQAFFFLAFFSLFFLLLIFGETPNGVVIAGLITGLFCLYHKKMSFLSSKLSSLIWIYIFFLGIALLSLATTISLPLTINKAIFFLFGFVCFFFFFQLNPKWFSSKLLKVGIVIVGLILGCLFLLGVLIPTLSTHLPAMNLLVTNYGHNHFSIYLLLLLPLGWELAEKKWNIRSFLFILVINLGLIFSFGRLSILLGLGETAVLGFLRRKSSSIPKIQLFFLLLPFVIGIIISCIFSFPLSKKIAGECLSSAFQKQLCKPLQLEDRPAYWLQATTATFIRPWTGWGGGTFNILSKKFAVDQSNKYSAYTHNQFLQTAAEYGLFGATLLILFCAVILRQASGNVIHRPASPALFISVAIICFIIDALFDYNWEYWGIWILFLMSVTLMNEGLPFKKKAHVEIAVQTIIWWVSCGVILLWSVGYLFSTVAWSVGKYDFSQRLFPFVYWRVEQVLTEKKVSLKTEQEILWLYQNNPIFIKAYLQNLEDPELKMKWLSEILVNDPWDISSQLSLLQLLAKEKKWFEYVTQLERLSDHYQGKNWWEIPEPIRMIILQDGSNNANLLLATNTQLARQVIFSLYKLEPASLNDHPFNLLAEPNKYPEKETLAFLAQIGTTANVWHYRIPLTSWFWQQGSLQKNWMSLTNFVENQLKTDPKGEWEIWQTTEPLASDQFNQAYNSGNYDQAQQILETWDSIFRLVTQAANLEHENIVGNYKQQLANNYVKLGDLQIKNTLLKSPSADITQAVKNYVAARKLVPSELQNHSFFFENCQFATCNWDTLTTFMNSLMINNNSTILLDRKKISMQTLQRLINHEIEVGDEQNALRHTQFLAQLFQDDYWASAQLGNFYLFIQQPKDAEQAFRKCLEYFGPAQSDKTNCTWGMYFIEHQWPGEQQFAEASKRILGN